MSTSIKSAVIIGSGRVAGSLARALKDAGIDISFIISRNKVTGQQLADQLGCRFSSEPVRTDDPGTLIILALPDRAIPGLLTSIPGEGQFIVHTSGTVGLLSARAKYQRTGVLYPLQTFTSGHAIDWRTVPICIEAQERPDLDLLSELAGKLTDSVYQLTTEERRWAHMCAVVANNFSNHMYALAGELLNSKDLPFDLIRPLIMETARKAAMMDPSAAQTGPALRGDQETIQRHLAALESLPEIREMYRLISESIKRKTQQNDEEL